MAVEAMTAFCSGYFLKKKKHKFPFTAAHMLDLKLEFLIDFLFLPNVLLRAGPVMAPPWRPFQWRCGPGRRLC